MTAQFPIPSFVRVEQSQITDALNELIVDINALFLEMGFAPGVVPSFESQMQIWWAALPTVLPATPGVFWNNGGTLARS